MVTASEEAALTLGSEELKNEQELARQDGKCKGRFRPRCQCRQNCRSVSFVHFAGRTLNAPSGVPLLVEAIHGAEGPFC